MRVGGVVVAPEGSIVNLTQGLHRAAQWHPDEIATICGNRVRTHAEVLDRAARLAGGLRALGLGEDDRVAVLGRNSDHYLETFAGTLWAGGVVVPVNLRWSVPEIVTSLVEVDARILVVDGDFAPTAAEIRDAHPRLEHILFTGEGPVPAGMRSFDELVLTSAPVEDAYRNGDDVAAIIYTGGTTGRPKGVLLTHANVTVSALGLLATEQYLTPGGAFLQHLPMFHIAGIAGWAGPVARGNRQVVIPGFEPVAVMTAIAEHGITDLGLVPTMIQMLVDHERVEEFDLSSVRRVYFGASPISDGLLQRAIKTMPDAGFSQAYGMTETTGVCTMLFPADNDDPVRRRSAGRAVPHAEIRIVDEGGAEVPRGTIGEVVVRGGHVTRGYWQRPEETAEALRGGWLHTGDGGYMDDDGFLYICDRIKDMIITGGENVYPAEVENVLGQHPAVALCAVIGVPDERWGERVHALVIPAAGATLTMEELRGFCAGRIAGYKTPKSMELTDSLPLSGAGKVLKTELRKRYRVGQGRAAH